MRNLKAAHVQGDKSQNSQGNYQYKANAFSFVVKRLAWE